MMRVPGSKLEHLIIGGLVYMGIIVALHAAGRKPKLPKDRDTEWHWLGTTPSWWNRMFHTRPKRRQGHIEEAVMKYIEPEDFEMLEKIETDVSHKPHKYYF